MTTVFCTVLYGQDMENPSRLL